MGGRLGSDVSGALVGSTWGWVGVGVGVGVGAGRRGGRLEWVLKSGLTSASGLAVAIESSPWAATSPPRREQRVGVADVHATTAAQTEAECASVSLTCGVIGPRARTRRV